MKIILDFSHPILYEMAVVVMILIAINSMAAVVSMQMRVLVWARKTERPWAVPLSVAVMLAVFVMISFAISGALDGSP